MLYYQDFAKGLVFYFVEICAELFSPPFCISRFVLCQNGRRLFSIFGRRNLGWLSCLFMFKIPLCWFMGASYGKLFVMIEVNIPCF